ncbi:odorant receptor 131-2-like [Pseudochaenichthys georgianus]|uniref:odorant receptor 131-2-like n=1 Tax=Pseudochaenichthys georgianus TaxID=52239 RepID=UPI00146A1AA5|nr:odorant receptor 131-2-like [Pseudochaenichthys georgianus]
MSNNSSLVGGVSYQQQVYRIIVVQILVVIFVYINLLLIFTFFKKECFYTNARYILFAVTLLSDSMLLIISTITVMFAYFRFNIQVGLCMILCNLLFLYSFVTPITLTAMTLERYVAICIPLRHGELCSTRSAMHCILIIHGLSAVPCIMVLSAFFATASLSLYTKERTCSMETFNVYRWQSHMVSAMNQLYFLLMLITIVVSYVKIVKVAKAASGENKKSTWKGLRTVILHAFQLLLCLIQLWCPFIEAALLPIDLQLYIDVRYNNYIMFILAPRCLSPLIYGLRDETFSHALKSYASFGLYKKNRI